ncbi:hypothetical protein H8959_013119 [Pygathrix nigripes]
MEGSAWGALSNRQAPPRPSPRSPPPSLSPASSSTELELPRTATELHILQECGQEKINTIRVHDNGSLMEARNKHQNAPVNTSAIIVNVKQLPEAWRIHQTAPSPPCSAVSHQRP